MQLDLFSTPGEPDLRDIVEAARPWLEAHDDPVVAYLPAACVGELYVGLTRFSFKGLARVDHIDAERHDLTRIERSLDQATVLYMPGGNTYVLSRRLHDRGLIEAIRERVTGGLPLVAFSAGAVICGPNMLTTNDMNCCACTQFAGLGLVPFNFNVHFPPEEGEARALRDERLWEYHRFYDNPVLALEDGAHVRAAEGKVEVVRGNCRLFERGKRSVLIEAGSYVKL